MNTETSASFREISGRVWMRFLSIYLLLYLLHAQYFLTSLPGISSVWLWLTTQTGRLLKGASYVNDVHATGSGDTLYHFVSVFACLLLAVAGTMIWSLVDSRRRSFERQQYWITVIFRYNLALILFSYGFSKVIKTQFPDASLFMLDSPLGESSPMGLAWKFFGYSTGYNLFLGLAEVIPGILLLFRRTSLAGALLSVGVMGNVALLNIFYDIPVKLFSIHLVLVSLFIAGPEIKRLYYFFFTKKVTPPSQQYVPVYTKRIRKYIYLSLKILSILVIIALETLGIIELREGSNELNLHPPLYGIYVVQQRQVSPAAPVHYQELQQLYLDKAYKGTLRLQSAGVVRCRYNTDTTKQILTIYTKLDTLQFHYRQLPENRLELSGILVKDTLHFQLLAADLKRFTLIQQPFRWVAEHPYNK
ncbi:hypothetical protein CLV59_104540 [Chitinophaga dinghuensis]|uniref:DoxX-like protein n=1 Tax=Chitinophaga dinghuensis TaxID=1539050 RepID=A0A327W2P5_9BACT|nr:hypothetical protein [Chitinophaga dinghuensis]RAJ82314.1 hypothetical protein CLV59_104540 [Chitinophaga dinghuensis]